MGSCTTNGYNWSLTTTKKEICGRGTLAETGTEASGSIRRACTTACRTRAEAHAQPHAKSFYSVERYILHTQSGECRSFPVCRRCAPTFHRGRQSTKRGV